MVIKGKGKFLIKFIPENKEEKEKEWEVFNFKGDGIAMGMYNTDESILFSEINRYNWICTIIIFLCFNEKMASLLKHKEYINLII
jgi:hypothetical protein